MDGNALSLLVGSALTALGGAVVVVLNAWHRTTKERRADAIGEWKELTSKLEAQGERQGAVIKEQQLALTALSAAHSDCREETTELRTCLHFFQDAMKRMRVSLAELGHDPGPVPDLPPVRERTPAPSEREIETRFTVRQAEQSAALVQEAAKVVNPPASGGTAP